MPTSARRRTGLISLRLRLTLIPAAILGLGLAVTIGFALHDAGPRVAAETGSGLRLGRILVEAALRNAAVPQDPALALASLQADLPQVRHIRLIFEPEPGVSAVAWSAPPASGKAKAGRPPRWFAALVSPPAASERLPVMVAGRRYGWIVIVSNPLDEADEIWNELGAITTLLGLVSAGIVAGVYCAASLALRPLRELAAGFDRLEHGKLDTRIAPIRVAELSRIGIQFNRLACSLGQATADNDRLIDRLISLQEAERREIAHELHDAFGPTLFGIRAELSCILRRAANDAAPCPEIREHAQAVAGLVDGIQRLNYRLLDRLRPLILEELGLGEALARLVESWQERLPAIAWSLHLPASDRARIAGPTGLMLYRAVQECLTNAARHAAPSHVAVTLQPGVGLAGPGVMVADDGRGLPAGHRFGFGLLGISERARAMGGTLSIAAAPGGGTLVAIALAASNAFAEAT